MTAQARPAPFVLRPPPAPPGGVIGKLTGVVRLAARISLLGARPVDRALLLAAPFALILARRAGYEGRLRLGMSITAFGRRARCTVTHFSHLSLLEGIFLDGDYAVEPLRAPKTIVDLGSNIGISLLYFHLRFPGARIVGVEPDPAAFALLRRNAGPLPGVTLVHAAVDEREGTTTLWSAPGATASALERSHGAQSAVEVPVRRLDGLLSEAGVERVEILKLVVEGSEFRALGSLDDLSRVDAITGEILFLAGDPQRSPEAFRTLLGAFDVSLREDKGDGFWQFHARRTADGRSSQPGG